MRRTIILGLTLLLIGGIANRVQADPVRRSEECRFKHEGPTKHWTYTKAVRTIYCFSRAFGVAAAVPLSIYFCETGYPVEKPHSDSVHGPLQYMVDTFRGHKAQQPAIVSNYELDRGVHNVRANLGVGIAKMRTTTQPWACA